MGSKAEDDIIVSLDKDRFRNDLGGLIEAYSEINRRIKISSNSMRQNALFALTKPTMQKHFLK